MALRGNLDDFNIVNILQMIKLENKTGRLALSEGDDAVKITFDNGSIIYAEGTPEKDEARLAGALLTNNILKNSTWKIIKTEHDDKLKPYWELLAKNVSSKTLLELIRRQVIDTVYSALRWEKGNYEFTPIKKLKYNSKIMAPVDVDALLIEGCKIADEWPRLVAALPSPDTLIIKNIMGEDAADESFNARALQSGASDFGTSLEYEILNARGITLTREQITVLNVIGDGKTVQEIIDSARQGAFETLESLPSLIRLGILKTTTRKKNLNHGGDKRKRSTLIITTLALTLIVTAGIVYQVTSWPDIFEAQKTGLNMVRKMQAESGLKNIERGLKIYTSLHRKTPESLTTLVKAGILEQSDLIDPWNAPYKLTFDKNMFALYSTGSDAFLSTDNVYLLPPSAQ